MQNISASAFVLAVLIMGCDAADPLVESIDHQTHNVYFEGNIPSDGSVAVSYPAFDQNGRSMDYIIALEPVTSVRGEVVARVFLPTTLDSLNSACDYSLGHPSADLTFYLDFDSDGRLVGDSVFDIPYPSDADVSESFHRVHFGEVVRVPGSATVRQTNQDGSESDEARDERRRLREARRNEVRQTNNVYFGGSATNFRIHASGYRAYDRAGRPHNYGIIFICGRSRCADGRLEIGVYMPGTLDSLWAIPGAAPYDEHPYDHAFTLSFDAQGDLLGDAMFTVPYPANSDVDPSFHTLNFERVTQRSAGGDLTVCSQDGLERR